MSKLIKLLPLSKSKQMWLSHKTIAKEDAAAAILTQAIAKQQGVTIKPDKGAGVQVYRPQTASSQMK